RYDEYVRLNGDILSLAVENTNLKAQNMAFGPAAEAAEAFGALMQSVARSDHGTPWQAEAIADRARLNVLEMQVLQGPHIAAADDTSMDRIESRMRTAE